MARLPIKHCSGAGYSPPTRHPIHLSLCSPSLSPLARVRGGVAATDDSRNVRRRTNCVHSPLPSSPPLPLRATPDSFHPVPLSPSFLLSLYLSFALSLDWPSDQRHGTRVNFMLQTREPLSVQLHVTFPFPSLAFDLKSELDHG